MSERAIIRRGDRTSHGGTVVEGHPTSMLLGREIALVGHRVVCPKCKGAFLRTEALVSGFYKQLGLRRWMEKPGRPADQRFHDFMQVMQWQLRHSAAPQKTE